MLDYPAVFRSRLLLAIGAVALFVLTFRTLDHSTALRPFLPYDSGQPAAQSPAELVSIVYDPRTEPNYVPRRPDVAKVSMLYGENELYVRAIDTHIRHSKRHGYPTYVLRKEMISGIWNKLLYLIHVMVAEMHKGEEGANWIMWVDADSAVVNPALPLSIFLPPENRSEIHFLGSKDQSGFNAGMFFIKINEWSVKTLAQAMTYQWHKPGIQLDFLEQTSLYLELNNTANREHVLYQPRKWFNTYEFHHAYEGVKGDMLVHFPGLGGDRWNHMAAWLDTLEGPGQAEWEVPLEQTEYPAKIAYFWDTLDAGEQAVKQARERIGQSNRVTPELTAAAAHLETVLWSETDQIEAMRAATAGVREHLLLMDLVGEAATAELRSNP